MSDIWKPLLMVAAGLLVMAGIVQLVFWLGREHGHLSCFSNGAKTFDADVELWSSSKGTMHFKRDGVWGSVSGDCVFAGKP